MAVGIERIISGRHGLICLIGLVCLMLACGGPRFNFEGHWTGKHSLTAPPGGDPAVLQTLSKVELTLRPNGRFELLEGGLPKEGTYRTEGMKAYLTVTTFMDRPIEDQGSSAVSMNNEIYLTAQKDGTILYTDPGPLGKEPVTLTRKQEESQPAK